MVAESVVKVVHPGRVDHRVAVGNEDLEDGEYRKGKQAASVFGRRKTIKRQNRSAVWVRAYLGNEVGNAVKTQKAGKAPWDKVPSPAT
jgi:hypothetical protein